MIRPGLIGAWRQHRPLTYWPAPRGARRRILARSAGDPTQFIDVRDLAGFILHAIEARSFGVFNADAAPGMLTMGALLAASQRAAARFQLAQAGSTVTWVPADFLEAQKVGAWQDMPVWIPSTGEYAGFGLRSTARAQTAGLKLRPLQATVDDTLQWWLGLPEERRAKPRAGLSPARGRSRRPGTRCLMPRVAISDQVKVARMDYWAGWFGVSSFRVGGWYPVAVRQAWVRENGGTVQQGHPAKVFGVSLLFSLLAAACFAWWIRPASSLGMPAPRQASTVQPSGRAA